MSDQALTRAMSRVPAVTSLLSRVSPLHRVVGFVSGAGVATTLSLLTLAPTWRTSHGLFNMPWLDGTALVCAMVALTCASELVAVPLRRDDALEELTLLDAVVLMNVLLLPLSWALVTSLGGLLLAYLIRRRQVIKVCFNLGNYACAASAAVAATHLVHVSPGEFDMQLALAMVAAATCFVGINTLTMALLLSTMGPDSFKDLVRQDLPLSALTVAGTVGLAGTVLALSVRTPVLLACSVLPAVALWYSYGASADKHEERRRSARVLAFSQVLAATPDRRTAVHAFLTLVREEFAADGALALTEADVVDELSEGHEVPETVPVTHDHRLMVTTSTHGELVRDHLPNGWTVAMHIPLMADGRRCGSVLIGSRRRKGIRPRDLTAATPIAGALAIALRNAEQAEALRSETSKLRAVVEQSGEGILVLDGGGHVQLWSPAMEALTGVKQNAAVGSSLREMVVAHDDSGTPMDPFDSASAAVSPSSPHATVDFHLRRGDGEDKAVRFSHAFAFEGDEPVRDVVIVSDLTAQWRAERMKTDFVATVSHELRTPLTPIKGYADLLLKRGDDMSLEKRQRALGLIVDRANHLGRLVDDLLLASSITSETEPQHSIDCTTQNLADLATRAVEDFPEANNRVTLVPPPDTVLVLADTTRTVQVVTNLLSNALKYSAAGTPITVTVEGDECAGWITVADSGTGIPQDQLSKVFDKFHRVEDPFVMSTSGTGLGLFISRHLARAMNGELTAESTLGVGSQFSLRLPAARTADVAYVTS